MEKFFKLFAVISLSAIAGLALAGCEATPQTSTTEGTAKNSEAEDLLDELIAQKIEEEAWSQPENFLGEYRVDASIELEGVEDTVGKLVFSYKEETDSVVVVTYDRDGGRESAPGDCEYDMGSKGVRSSVLFLHCRMDSKVDFFSDFSFIAEGNEVILEGESYLTSGADRLLIATYTGSKVG